jgi:uncharacterized membrane protein
MNKTATYKYFWLIAVVSVIIIFGLWIWNWLALNDYPNDVRGTHGDMFGAVNAIFSGLAFAGIIISLYLQRIDLKNQQQQLELNYEEVKQTNREFKIQNDTLQIQKFENQYYKMIDLHKSNVNEIIIPFFDSKEATNSSRDNKKIELQSAVSKLRELAGKKGFVDMVQEIEYCLKIAHEVLSSQELNYKEKDINEFAYSIFFFGVYSDVKRSEKIHQDFQDQIIRVIKKEQSDYKKSLISGANQKVKTRYVPFQGHESRLGHYFRHLFQTVKYVVMQEDNGLIEYVETRQYLRVLRAQLSNSEQQLLYFNYICGFGANWDKLGDKGYQFLTKYRMIHNMPVDRVEVVENPREHFKDYICNHCSQEDELFEWGDKREELNCDG